MPEVRMTVSMSGGGPGGRDWRDYPAGATLDVPDWEAENLIRIGLAVPAGEGGAGESAVPAPEAEAPAHTEPGAGADAESVSPVAPPEVSPVTEVSPVAEVPAVPEPAPQPAAEPVPEPAMAGAASAGIPAEAAPDIVPARPPAPSDIKQRWIDYAILQGENPDTARDMTKADLMSKYGGRL